MKIFVIVLTYNGREYLDGCFGSISRTEKGSHDVRVVAVDNASSDGTPAEIRGKFSWVELVETGTNLGYAGGMNFGIRRALDSGADFVFLLNQDTEVTPAFLVEVIAAAEAHPRAGAVQPLILLSPERHLINSRGNAIHFLGFGYCLGYRDPASSVKPSFAEIPYASGAAVLLRASSLRQVGLLDERFFMYHEDLDLGWRLRLAGMQSVLAPRSIVFHKYEFSRSMRKFFFMERNRYIVLLSRLSSRSILLLAPLLALSEAGLFAASVRGGWWREKLKVYRAMLSPSFRRHVAAERARTRRIRKATDGQIARIFSSRIEYQETSGPLSRVANPLMEAAWKFIRPLFL